MSNPYLILLKTSLDYFGTTDADRLKDMTCVILQKGSGIQNQTIITTILYCSHQRHHMSDIMSTEGCSEIHTCRCQLMDIDVYDWTPSPPNITLGTRVFRTRDFFFHQLMSR